jgi:hypothetical protein
MNRPIVKISCVVLLTLLASANGRGQTQIIERTGGIVQPLADGANRSESISDDVALRALFLNLAVPPNPNAEQSARLRVRVARMRLDDQDFKILTEELGRFYGLMAEQNARIAAARDVSRLNPTSTALAKVVETDQQLSTLVRNSYDALVSKLSPSGRANLQAHITYVKTRIKIIPPPDMSPKHH